MQLAERKAESNNNILFNKLLVFVFVAFSLICLESLGYIYFFTVLGDNLMFQQRCRIAFDRILKG